MRLTEQQLTYGLEALGVFLHEEEWTTHLNDYGRHHYRRQYQDWLLPFLIKLPDQADRASVEQNMFYAELMASAEHFLLDRMRENKAFDLVSERELKLRLDRDEVLRAHKYLSMLVCIFLSVVETMPTPTAALPSLEELAKNLAQVDLDQEFQKLIDSKEFGL